MMSCCYYVMSSGDVYIGIVFQCKHGCPAGHMEYLYYNPRDIPMVMG